MNTRALVIIDVQLGMFDPANPVYEGELLLTNIGSVLDKARSIRMPIVYVQHNARAGQPLASGQPGWVIHPQIKPQSDDIVIQKSMPDSFHRTTLQHELDSRGITELVIAGIQSEVCVDTTCRRASSLGYRVTLLGDAHSTWHSEQLRADQIIDHHNSVLRWFAEVKDCAWFVHREKEHSQ